MGLPIGVGTYPIDTAHSQLGFSLMHLGISAIRGTFDEYNGELKVGDDLDGTSVTIDAEMASINSGNSLRDENVHAVEYLDVANHPRMSFRSTSIAESDSGYALTGDLTIRNVTVPMRFDVTYNGEAVFSSRRVDALRLHRAGDHQPIGVRRELRPRRDQRRARPDTRRPFRSPAGEWVTTRGGPPCGKEVLT